MNETAWPAVGETVAVLDISSRALRQRRFSTRPPTRTGTVVESPADGRPHLTIDTGGDYGCVTYSAFGFPSSYTWEYAEAADERGSGKSPGAFTARTARDPGLPDPYTEAGKYLFARERQWRNAHRELAEAWVFVAAEVVRGQWPAAHCIVFDRTKANRNRGPMEFLRIEDRDGATLAVSSDLPTSEEDFDHGVALTLHHHLVHAERYLNVAGLVGAGRVWNIVNEYDFNKNTAPPHLCRITLPPAVRPDS
ncbi:hypothetical protein [Streptomyces sp. NPDC055036]